MFNACTWHVVGTSHVRLVMSCIEVQTMQNESCDGQSSQSCQNCTIILWLCNPPSTLCLCPQTMQLPSPHCECVCLSFTMSHVLKNNGGNVEIQYYVSRSKQCKKNVQHMHMACSEWRLKKIRTLWKKLQYRVSKIKQCKKMMPWSIVATVQNA